LLNVPIPPRLNVCPPRAGIEPKLWPPLPRGAAVATDAVSVSAARQLKKSI